MRRSPDTPPFCLPADPSGRVDGDEPAVQAQPAGDPGAAQERQVVAGHEQGAPVGGEGLGELAGAGQVEVVGRLVDRQGRVQGQVLAQVADPSGDPDRAAGRAELPGDQPEQGRLARPVDPDEGGPPGPDGEAEPVEQDAAVGPGEVEVVNDCTTRCRRCPPR